MTRFGLAALCLLYTSYGCSNHVLVQAWLPSTTLSTTLCYRKHFHRAPPLQASLQQQHDLMLYNTASRKKELFKPQLSDQVSMYTCGPTVYDFAHVGNFRAFLTYDVLKRVLLYFNYNVKHILNLTDVDDKIIKRSRETNESVKSITTRYTTAFMDDLKALNIIKADRYPKATEHIDEMVNMVLELYKKGLAYQTPDKSWYFACSKQEGYGTRLVQLNFDDMLIDEDNTEKQSPIDFCLWKAYKPNVDLPELTWDTPLGKGRPGWHLECSAMARKYFGDATIDIHCGGVDLTFPHHENEIAQSEGVSNKQFCNCWIHNGFVNINDEKMSKSLGNFKSLSEACPKPINVRAYRYLVVSSQYRNPLSFTTKAMEAAKGALKRMDKIRNEIKDALMENANVVEDPKSEICSKIVPAQIANFEAALMDDLSMPRAAASLFACVKAAEKELKRWKKSDCTTKLDLAGLQAVYNAMDQMDKVFGIFYSVPLTEEEAELEAADKKGIVPSEVMDLVQQRSAAKDAKDWELADSLRARIKELGFAVKDVKGGEPIVNRITD